MTKIHNSATCTAGFNSRPCDMCQFAREVEENRSKLPSEPLTTEKGNVGFLVPEAKNVPQGNSGAGNGIPAPTFEQEWQDAPRWTTCYTEQQVAEYWFIRGQHAKEVELAATMNMDMKEMVRAARERMGRND